MAKKTRRNLRQIHVNAGGGYDVLIEPGILADAGDWIRKVLPGAEKALVVCDRSVLLPQGETVCLSIDDAGVTDCLCVLEGGEQNKNLATYASILESLAEKRLSRSDCVVALGGGVTGDMAGFAAATYLRGIAYVQIPTTLLAMVDSSVGGKTAVDLPSGKNLAGAFCQPSLVLCDPLALATLPDEVFRDGCAEVLKYGVLYSREFFLEMKDAAESRVSGQSLKQALAKRMGYVIETCVRFKRDVVEVDEYDRCERKKLNLGHTAGHAIEACSGYRVPHGCAVAIGMAIMARAAVKRGMMPEVDARELEEMLRLYGLPTETEYDAERLAKAALSDKKATQRAIDLIVPRRIGDCDIVRAGTDELASWIGEGLAW